MRAKRQEKIPTINCPMQANENNDSCHAWEGRLPSRFAARIIVEGETGFIVEDIDRAVEAVGKIEQLSRARCRREFEQRFTDRHMAEDHIRIYQQLLSRSSSKAAA
jgi:hypothetical protein